MAIGLSLNLKIHIAYHGRKCLLFMMIYLGTYNLIGRL